MGDLVSLRAGDRVTLVCVSDGSNAMAFAATVTSQRGSHVDVTLDEPYGNTVRPYILVSGEGDGANFVAIEESAASGAHVPLTTFGPWQNAADRRASARFPTYLPCQLVNGSEVAEGHLLDLSAHGVAIESVGWAGGTFTLRVDAGSGPVDIPCETVSLQNTVAGLVVVHARFQDLTVGEGMAVMALSELVRADFESAQSRLVTPFRRPSHSRARG